MLLGSLIVGIIFILILIFYKRDFFIKNFSFNTISPSRRFQEELEQTGDLVIKRLEEQIVHLEYLLEEANEKMTLLDEKIQTANKILNKEYNENRSMKIETNLTAVNYSENVKKPFTDLNIDLYRDMPRKDKRSLIVEMTDLGYDITEIAKATGISKGEIMLLLQLNKEN